MTPVRTLFQYPFRVFFLSVGVWALLAIALWVAVLAGGLGAPFALVPLHWHQHEMTFAVLNAAIAGFLLTAVCVWTGTERLHGAPLLALWSVWLAGRLLVTLDTGLPAAWVVAVNLAFLPLVALDAGRRILGRRQYQHLKVLLVLAVLWVAQADFLLSPDPVALEVALLAASALMMVIGGRITPAFSANWLRAQGRATAGLRNPPWLESAVLVALLLVAASLFAGAPLWTAALAAGAALLGAVRVLLWRIDLVRGEPLLWILHLSLLWIPAGLLLLCGGRLGWWAGNAWSHAIGVGAMASLILGVMTRVALGHTGRPMVLPKGMLAGYLSIQLAALLRVLTALGLLPWLAGVQLSALFWSISFALFLLLYAPVLWRPRVDGRPG